MDEKNNQELSVDELLAKLKSNLMEEGEASETAEPAPETPASAAEPGEALTPEAPETDGKAATSAVTPETEGAAVAEEIEEMIDTDAAAETSEEEPETAPAAQSLPEVDENDIFAAWGLNPGDVKKEKTQSAAASVTDALANTPADTGDASLTAKRTLRYRIARVEKKDDFAARKQTETQKASVDFDRTDYTLIKQALGMEKPAEGWADTADAAFEVAHESTGIPSSIDAPHDEFTYQRQRDDIAAGYKKKLRTSRAKLIFTAVAALALLFIECLPALGVAVPEVLDRGYYPVVWSMATLQLLLIAGAFCYREIVNGTLGIFRGRLTGGGVLAIFILLSIICDIVSCVGGAGTEVYNFSAVLCALVIRWFDYSDLRRESMAFEIASAPGTGKYVAAHMSEEETARVGGDDPDAFALCAEKCGFVENYFARTGQARTDDFAINRYLVPITLTVALIAAIFGAVRGGGGLSAVSTFDAVLAIGLPALIFLGGSYPLYSAAKKLYKSESALIGETAPEEYAGASVICFDDADAFPSYGVSLENLRIYGKGDIETIIEQMGAVFGKLGGPLRHVFSLMTTDCPRPYNTKIEGICEDGVCARVDGKTLFIGSASYMEANGLTVSDKSDELGGKRFSTMYLAQDGALRAKFFIRYTVDGGFETMVRKLARHGIASVILTGDSNISDELLARSMDLSRLPVKVMRRHGFENTLHGERADSGVVTRGSASDLVGAVTMCDKLCRVFTTLKAAKIASVVICAVLCAVAGWLGMGNAANSMYAAIYQLFWLIPCLLVSKFNL